MAGFAHIGDYIDAYEAGKTGLITYRKSPSVATTTNVWFDLSMSPGNPVPQYYAASPLTSTTLNRSTDGGLNHGNNVSPSYKYLHRMNIMSNSATGLPMPMILCDYLLYYPFCDTGTNDVQAMNNTISLPRYTTGEGVQVMAVSVAPNSGASQPTFSFSYTNSAGVSGRTSQLVTMNTAIVNGSILNSDTTNVISVSPFIGLQAGDKGVRSIESVTLPSLTEVGLFALVLVKPLFNLALLEQTAPCEIEPIRTHCMMTRIYDDAYLNMICLPGGSLSGVSFFGELETIWN